MLDWILDHLSHDKEGWIGMSDWLKASLPLRPGLTLKDALGREWTVNEVHEPLIRIRTAAGAVQMRDVDEFRAGQARWWVRRPDWVPREEPMAQPQPDPIHEKIENWFTYHPPVDDQPARYNRIRQAGLAFANVLAENCPPSADLTVALRHVRQAVMWANASVACDGK